MITLRRKQSYLLIVGLVIGFLGLSTGCQTVKDTLSTKDPSEKFPIRVLSISLAEEQREELFAQFGKFSEKHHLEFHLSFYEGKEVFFVEMYGEGLEILALSNTGSTTELDITFYEKDPANPPSQETVDELFDDLKSFISEIPHVLITNEK